jgi:hypothetical protein
MERNSNVKSLVRSGLSVLLVAFVAYHHAQATPVPEIDPTMGVGALALLGGAVMVIRGRRKI